MNRIALILYTSIILVLSSASAGAQGRVSALRESAESMLVDAVQAYDSGDTDAAMARLSVITGAFPDNDAAHYYLGLCHVRKNDADAALSEFQAASRLDPSNYWYRDRIATLYSLTGQDELAVEVYEGLLKDFPRKIDLYYALVNLYARVNRLDKVMQTLDDIETMVGRDEQTALARYDILMHQNKTDEAFALLEDLNEEYPSPQILSMMGDARLSDYDDSLAMSYYDRALELDSEYAPALLGKSEVYRIRRSFDGFFETLGRFASSASIPAQMKSSYLTNLTGQMDGRFFQTFKAQLDTLYETGVRAHPADSSMLLAAGTYYYRTDRRDRGVELFRTNSSLYPDDFNARAMYIQSLSYNEDWSTLLEASEEAFAAFPDEPAFLNMRVMAYYNLGALSTIGDSYHQLNDEKEAFKAYEKALKINPKYAPVLNNYAYYLSLTGKNLSKAAAMSKITVEQEPDNAPTSTPTAGYCTCRKSRRKPSRTSSTRCSTEARTARPSSTTTPKSFTPLASTTWPRSTGTRRSRKIPRTRSPISHSASSNV